jgi:hypothetical protein
VQLSLVGEPLLETPRQTRVLGSLGGRGLFTGQQSKHGPDAVA